MRAETPFQLDNALLPQERGELSAFVIERLRQPAHDIPAAPAVGDDPLTGDDIQLALYTLYELHYRGFQGVDEEWEWQPTLLRLRAVLERHFESALRSATLDDGVAAPDDMAEALQTLIEEVEGPSLSRYLETRASIGQFREFIVHRSAYQLKEADPHSWAIPRLSGRAKVALVEIQSDEYGGGRPERQHARLFAATMDALDLDPSYGAYLDLIPGYTLATVNLMSMCGLHRRLRGAIVGHLAVLEMDSTLPNRRYGNALRRLGYDAATTDFFDEHVEADAVHEALATHDLAAALAIDDPEVASDILFGARAMLLLDAAASGTMLRAWAAGESSLRLPITD